MVFVNSMSDLYHEEVPFLFISEIFDVMREHDRHTYQLLTKRPERMLEFYESAGRFEWPEHIWAGVSVENQYWADRRVPLLRQLPARIRFLSCEPLLKPVELELDGISWVIVGGESGRRARPMKEAWVLGIKSQCERAGVAFFFKQWGGRTSKSGGRELTGQEWSQMPVTVPA